MTIRFNYPHKSGNELEYVKDAMTVGRLAGDGPYTEKCSNLLEDYLNTPKVLLTHSCTAALEMAAILAGIMPDDEVIMPSYTFVSTANAFVLRGGVPVFIDIRGDTLNIDESLIEKAITKKTKAICVVHYAGVSCEMDQIMAIASKYNLLVIEDAAQALGSSYKGKKLGTIGDLATFSFHETKNIISGEGGCLVINNTEFEKRAEIIREKGTNRSLFFRGEVDKYTWVDIGSSFLPSELVAAFLYAQLENLDQINAKRMSIWKHYLDRLTPLFAAGKIKLTDIPKECTHNAHLFYFIVESHTIQHDLLAYLKKSGISGVFHYVPLHSSVAGEKYGKTPSRLLITENIHDKLIRLPLWPDLKETEISYVCDKVSSFFEQEDKSTDIT